MDDGVLCINTPAESRTRGMTLAAMSRAMHMEQIGSARIQPNILMRMAEIITPTDPKVSARTWRNTPLMIAEPAPVGASVSSCE